MGRPILWRSPCGEDLGPEVDGHIARRIGEHAVDRGERVAAILALELHDVAPRARERADVLRRPSALVDETAVLERLEPACPLEVVAPAAHPGLAVRDRSR